MIDPHGMDPQTVLRFVSAIGGWPGKVVVIGCEPGEVDDVGLGLTPPVAAAVERARRARASRRSTSCAPTRPTRALTCTSSRSAQRGRRHGRPPRRRAARDASSTLRVGALRQVVPDSLDVLLRDRRARDGLRGRAARAGGRAGAAALRGVRERVGARHARVPLPALRRRRTSTVRQRGRARGRVDRGRGGGRMHRVKVRVVEDALDANNTIARANRDDFDRAGVTVVNLMSAPGAGKTTLLERVLGARRRRRPRRRARGRRRRAASTPTGSRTCTSRSSQLNTDAGFGGECHLDANMVRSALPALPLDELDLLIIENVGNLVCPAEFRVGEDARIMVVLGRRGRGQAAQVPADVPRLRARGRQQDRPARARRLRPGHASCTTSTPCIPASRTCSSARAPARASTSCATWLARLPERAGAPA